MHYYIYEFCVTFENGIWKTFKNALVMGFAMFPANLLLTILVTAVTVFAFMTLPPFLIIMLMFLIWISFMRFPIDFYVARMIKRRFIDNEKNAEDKE